MSCQLRGVWWRLAGGFRGSDAAAGGGVQGGGKGNAARRRGADARGAPTPPRQEEALPQEPLRAAGTPRHCCSLLLCAHLCPAYQMYRYRFGPAYLLDVMDATRPGGQGGLGTMLDQDNCWNHVMWRFFRKTSDGPFDQKGLPQVLRCLGDICR